MSNDCLVEWRIGDTIILQQLISDGTCLKPCHCHDVPVSKVTLLTDLTQESDMESDMESDSESENRKWLCNELYSLALSNK